MVTEPDGSITGDLITGLTTSGKTLIGADSEYHGKTVFVDFYVVKNSKDVSELQIDADHFAGNYYVEASTLFRRESDGVDMPAEITIPNVKIPSKNQPINDKCNKNNLSLLPSIISLLLVITSFASNSGLSSAI